MKLEGQYCPFLFLYAVMQTYDKIRENKTKKEAKKGLTNRK